MPTEWLFSSGVLIAGVVVFVLVAVPLIVAKLPAQRRCRHDPHGELAHRRHRHLSRARQVEGDSAAHHRHHAVEQGDQRRPRHHRPDRRHRRGWRAAADQGAGAGQRHRVGGRHRRAHQDGGQPLLLQARGRPDQHAHRPALELRPARDQPADARPALLGALDPVGVAGTAARRLGRRRSRRTRPRRQSWRMPTIRAPRTRTIRSP